MITDQDRANLDEIARIDPALAANLERDIDAEDQAAVNTVWDGVRNGKKVVVELFQPSRGASWYRVTKRSKSFNVRQPLPGRYATPEALEAALPDWQLQRRPRS